MLRGVGLIFAPLLLGACRSELRHPQPVADGPSPVEWTSPGEEIRTADPFRRGLDHRDFPRLQLLADGVYSYEQLRSAGEEWFTTVSLIVLTGEGVLVADGQGSVEETQRLVDRVATLTPLPITHVVVASDHGDHTGGNAAFPAGVEFIAHPTSGAALEALARSRPDGDLGWGPPNRWVEDEWTLELGGRTIRTLFLGRAHTGGDLMVHLPQEGILFMSEAYLHRVFPAMRSAYPSEWLQTLEHATSLPGVEIFVPGHGFVDRPEVLRQELTIFQEAIGAVIEEVSALYRAGFGVEEAQAKARFEAYADWSLWAGQGPIAVRQIYRELSGELP
jgi:cyclase